MSEFNSIKSYKPSHDLLDFDHLKQFGIESIQKYAGKVWTDYNTHDPGITILEVVCFALTEMGFRCRYPVQDLFADRDGKRNCIEQFTADRVLFTNPITKLDYRKLLLDLDDVRNVWIEPDRDINDYQGLWKINVESLPGTDPSLLFKEIETRLHENRNICEDFSSITFVEYEAVGFKIEIEIEENVEIRQLNKEIFKVLEHYLNPSSQYYGLEELIDKGYSSDEIFLGPKPTHGYLLERELIEQELKNKIFASDIYHLLMDIPGITYLKRLRIIDAKGKTHKWVHAVQEGKMARLDVDRVDISFFHLDTPILQKSKANLFDKEIYQSVVKSKHKNLKFPKENHQWSDFGKYQSIQNDFPEVYGIGKSGIAVDASNERSAQAKQLKAYLLLIDQLNANFIAQLENLSTLFSISDSKRSYFFEGLFEVPDIEYLYLPFVQLCQQNGIKLNDRRKVKELWKNHKGDVQNAVIENLDQIIEEEHDHVERRNRLFNHLLARFSFKFEEFSIDNEFSDEDLKRIIKKKENILQSIDYLSSNKISGQNIFLLGKNENSKSGLYANLNHFLSLSTSEGDKDQPFEITDKDSNEQSFRFFNTDQRQVPGLISDLGRKKDNYRILKVDEAYKIELVNHQHVVAEYMEQFEEETKATETVNEIIQQVMDINDSFESVYYFEHILLRPPDEASAFHFQFNDEQGNPIFSSAEPLTRNQREKVWQQILSFGQNRDNYTIKNVANNQYKFAVLNNNKKEIALSNMFFHNEEHLQTMITSAINTITKLQHGKLEEKKCLVQYPEIIRPDYKYKDIYSNIITYALPGWHYRFKNEHARTWVENRLMEMTPVHLYPNFKWMDYDTLNSAVGNYYKILRAKTEPDFDPSEVYALQKDLFQLII